MSEIMRSGLSHLNTDDLPIEFECGCILVLVVVDKSTHNLTFELCEEHASNLKGFIIESGLKERYGRQPDAS